MTYIDNLSSFTQIFSLLILFTPFSYVILVIFIVFSLALYRTSALVPNKIQKLIFFVGIDWDKINQPPKGPFIPPEMPDGPPDSYLWLISLLLTVGTLVAYIAYNKRKHQQELRKREAAKKKEQESKKDKPDDSSDSSDSSS